MGNKANLRLVYSKPQKENRLQKLWNEFTKVRSFEIEIPARFRWWKTESEKAKILKKTLTQAFGDYDYTTEQVNIYPALRAEEEVKKMITNRTLDYYYKRHLMSEKLIKKLDKMAAKYKEKTA